MKKLPCIHILLMLICSFKLNGQARNEYLLLKGNVGSAQVTMHLYKSADRYSGHYYQEKSQRPVEIYGIDSTMTGKIKMFVTYKGKKEIFSLDRIDKKFTGSMEIEGSGKAVQVILRPANAPLKLSYLYHEDSVKLLDLPSGYPLCKVVISSHWPDIKTDELDWLKEDIRETFTGVNIYKEEMSLLAKMLTDRELNKYKKEYLNVSEKDLKESSKSFSMDIKKELQVLYHTHKFISFFYKEYSFTGGAHGNTSGSFFTVDNLSRKKISLTGLFNRSAMEDLLPILEKWYLVEKGMRPGSNLKEAGLFEKNITKNPSSCYVTDKGVGFLYNPYTIAPYSTGMIHIFVPYTDLTPLINKAFAKYMNWL